VDATPSGVRGSSLRQLAVSGFKAGQRFVPALVRINVEHEEPSIFARRQTDVCLFPCVPPLPDFCIVGRGIVYPVFRARVLTDTVTHRLMTGMLALIFTSVRVARMLADSRTSDSPAGTRLGRVSGRGVHGENRPAERRTSQRGHHLIHFLPCLLKEFHQESTAQILHPFRCPRVTISLSLRSTSDIAPSYCYCLLSHAPTRDLFDIFPRSLYSEGKNIFC
jgi:hypothetical protein